MQCMNCVDRSMMALSVRLHTALGMNNIGRLKSMQRCENEGRTSRNGIRSVACLADFIAIPREAQCIRDKYFSHVEAFTGLSCLHVMSVCS